MGIRVGIIGVGSCASSLVQLIEQAKASSPTAPLPGVPFDLIGPYRASDVEWSCAFDVDSGKVGHDLAEAIFTAPNAAICHASVAETGVRIAPGPLLDGLTGPLSEVVTPTPLALNLDGAAVADTLRHTRTEVVVCFLPTGSAQAVRTYARAAAAAGVAFINATPEKAANDPETRALFEAHAVPLLGDDLRSHLGATTLHMALIDLFRSRGITVANTYQLNFGGNMDFLNMTSPARAASKQQSKRVALGGASIDATDVAAGPNGYVKFLGDTKVCYLRLEGDSILGSRVAVEARLEVEDSPNAAGVVVNAIRVAKCAAVARRGGVITEICPFLFKSPTTPIGEPEALAAFRKFVALASQDIGG